MPTDRQAIPADAQRTIFVEAGHRCACCGIPFPLERAHIVPWRDSADHSAENLLCLCANCHQMADRDWDKKTFYQDKRRPWVNRQSRTVNPSLPEPNDHAPIAQQCDSHYGRYHAPSLNFIIPPDPGFVGRESILKDIESWYQSDEVRVGALVGLGGIGKSSIARRWCDELMHRHDRHEHVFWWGFYQNSSLSDCLDTLLLYLRGDIKEHEKDAKLVIKMNMLKSSLQGQRVMVVFDGLEAIQLRPLSGNRGTGHRNPDYLTELLKAFAESTGIPFLLVTTRYQLDELRGYEGSRFKWKVVDGLDFEETKSMFAYSEISAEEHEVETVWRAFEGHALSLRLLTTYLNEYYDGNIHAVQEIPALTSTGIVEYADDRFDGGKARRILTWYESKLSEAQRVFLKIFSLFATSVTQADLRMVFRSKHEQLNNDELVSLTEIGFLKLLKKLSELRLLSPRQKNSEVVYESHPLIKEYFASLVDKEALIWHRLLTNYYQGETIDDDCDQILRDKQIIHHALRSRDYESATQASGRLLACLRDSLTPNGTIGLIRPYRVASKPLAGTSYSEVIKKARQKYTDLRGGPSHNIHIRSAYFEKEEIDFAYFWERISKKSFPERMRRIKLLPCAIELIRNSTNEPFSTDNPNRPFEIIHRFAGVTKSHDLFFVQIMEDTRTGSKYFMSTFLNPVSAE